MYASGAAALAHLSRWAAANPRYLRLTDEATDPQTGRSLALAVFGDASANATSAQQQHQRPRVFITCGIHARELITVDTCVTLLRLLAAPDGDDDGGDDSNGSGVLAILAWPEMRAALGRAGLISAQAASGSAARALPAVRAAARRLASQVELTVMPLLNPDSRATIEQKGSYALRVNGRGVDLNRNMLSHWWPPTAGQRPGHDTYPGPSAASEWETRAVNAATATRGVDSYVDLHSGFVSLMGPSAHSACGLKEALTRGSARAHDRAMRAMQRAMPTPTVAGPTARVLYSAAGTTLDDAFNLRGARVSVAVEIYDSSFSTRAGYSCPSYEAFWGAPCASSEEGGDDSVRCVEIRPAAAGAREGAAAAAAAPAVPPRVPDGELLWDEIDDAAKLRALRERHGVSEAQVARLASSGARLAGADGAAALPDPVVPAAPWWAQDPVMRHASGDASDRMWDVLTTFNPTEPADFRDVVSRWVAALWLFALDAER